MAQAQRESPPPAEPLAEGTRVSTGTPVDTEQREIEQAEAAPESQAIDLTEQMAALLAEIDVTNDGRLIDPAPVPVRPSVPEAVRTVEREAPAVEDSAETPAESAPVKSVPEELPIVDAAAIGDAAGESESTLAGELDAALKEASEALEQVVAPEDPPAVAEHDPIEVSADQIAVDPASPSSEERAAASAGTPTVDLNELDALLAQQAEELEQAGRESSAPAAAPSNADQDDDRFSEARLAAADSTPPAPEVAMAGHSTAHSTAVAAGTPAPPVFVSAPVATVAPTSAPAHETKPTAPARKRITLGPAFSATGKALGFPMALLPASARDAVAYLAAVTLFNALAVWGYMLFVYKAPVPPPAHDAPALHAVQPPPDAHGDPHAPGAADGLHKTKADEGHAAPADAQASGEEAGHGHDAHAAASKHGGHEPAPH